MTPPGLWTLAALVLLAAGGDAAAPAAGPGYHVLKKISLPGEEGWDFLTVDLEARRLYVTRGRRVVVLDADKLEVVGEVADTPGVHGVAVVPKLHRGFTSNGADG